MISTSLKRPGTEFTFPIEWIPRPPYWKTILGDGRFSHFLVGAQRFESRSLLLWAVLFRSDRRLRFARIHFPGVILLCTRAGDDDVALSFGYYSLLSS